jgi:hypothetical protein
MTNFLFIAIPVALLLLLWMAGRRSAAEGSMLPTSVDSFEGPVRLPSRQLLDQCLSAEDVEFAARFRAPALLRLLLHERRRLALAWLRQTRREASRLFGFHVRAVRQAADLRPVAELKLLFSVGAFFAVYALLIGATAFYGPFRTRGFLQGLRGLADLLATLGDRITASIGSGLMPHGAMAGGR